MKSSDITEVITKLCIDKNSSDRAILIDGVWGCGKTYSVYVALDNIKKDKKEIKSTIKKDKSKQNALRKNLRSSGTKRKDLPKKITINNSKPRPYYISLYGAKNMEDVNAKVLPYLKSTWKKVLKECLKYGSALIASARSNSIVKEALDGLRLSLEESESEISKIKIKKNITIIFDDLERTDMETYLPMLGVINVLVASGIKVVCVYNSKKFVNSDKNKEDIRKTHFDEFIEKAFNREYIINEEPFEIICNDIFKEPTFHKKDITILAPHFDGNLRTAKKVYSLYTDVVDYLNSSRIEYNVLVPDFSLLCACTYAIKIALQDFTDKLDEKQRNSYPFYNYSYEARNLSTEETENFVCFFILLDDKQHIFDYFTPSLTAAILNFYLHKESSDLHGFFANFIVDVPLDISHLEYLSIENNINVSDSYIEQIKNNKVIFDEKGMNQLVHFVLYTAIDIDEDLTTIIGKKVAEQNDFERLSEYKNSQILSEQNTKVYSIYSEIITKAIKECELASKEAQNKKYEDLISDGNIYQLVLTMREDCRSKSINDPTLVAIRKTLKNYNYFMEDLSGDIKPKDWAVYQIIAEIMISYGTTLKEYIGYLEKVIAKHDSKIARNRANQLLRVIQLTNNNDLPEF